MDDQNYLRQRAEEEKLAARSASSDQARFAHDRLSKLFEQRLSELNGQPVAKLPPRF